MAPETFEKVLVKDDKIGCITQKVKFQVLKGGQNITRAAVQGNLRDDLLARVQRNGAEPGDHHKQGGDVAVHGYA